MTITETCSCGATFTATGTERLTGVGYEAAKWRQNHRCAQPATRDLPETSED